MGGIGWILSKLNNLPSYPIVVKRQNAYRFKICFFADAFANVHTYSKQKVFHITRTS